MHSTSIQRRQISEANGFDPRKRDQEPVPEVVLKAIYLMSAVQVPSKYHKMLLSDLKKLRKAGVEGKSGASSLKSWIRTAKPGAKARTSIDGKTVKITVEDREIPLVQYVSEQCCVQEGLVSDVGKAIAMKVRKYLGVEDTLVDKAVEVMPSLRKLIDYAKSSGEDVRYDDKFWNLVDEIYGYSTHIKQIALGELPKLIESIDVVGSISIDNRMIIFGSGGNSPYYYKVGINEQVSTNTITDLLSTAGIDDRRISIFMNKYKLRNLESADAIDFVISGGKSMSEFKKRYEQKNKKPESDEAREAEKAKIKDTIEKEVKQVVQDKKENKQEEAEKRTKRLSNWLKGVAKEYSDDPEFQSWLRENSRMASYVIRKGWGALKWAAPRAGGLATSAARRAAQGVAKGVSGIAKRSRRRPAVASESCLDFVMNVLIEENVPSTQRREIMEGVFGKVGNLALKQAYEDFVDHVITIIWIHAHNKHLMMGDPEATKDVPSGVRPTEHDFKDLDQRLKELQGKPEHEPSRLSKKFSRYEHGSARERMRELEKMYGGDVSPGAETVRLPRAAPRRSL